MANGDDAAAAGLATVPPTGPLGKARLGYDWINYALDRIVTRVFGTAQIADGAVTPAKLSATAVPIAKGGTGATTAAQARTNIVGFTPVKNGPGNQLMLERRGTDLAVEVFIDNTNLGTIATVATNGDLGLGGGKLNSPAGRGYGVVSPVAAHWDVDGWLGIAPSARRFKQDIRPHVYTVEQLQAIELVTYRLRAAVEVDPDAAGEVGVIAEQLLDMGLGEFVAFDADGQVLTVNYERLSLVTLGALQQLVTEFDLLAERVERLENRLEFGA